MFTRQKRSGSNIVKRSPFFKEKTITQVFQMQVLCRNYQESLEIPESALISASKV